MFKTDLTRYYSFCIIYCMIFILFIDVFPTYALLSIYRFYLFINSSLSAEIDNWLKADLKSVNILARLIIHFLLHLFLT